MTEEEAVTTSAWGDVNATTPLADLRRIRNLARRRSAHPLSERRIKIGPLWFDIEEVPDLKDDDGKTSLLGDIKNSLCRIRIDGNANEQIKHVIVWHETLHAILDRHSLNEIKGSEKIVEALAYGIVEVLQDNPWMAEGEP